MKVWVLEEHTDFEDCGGTVAVFSDGGLALRHIKACYPGFDRNEVSDTWDNYNGYLVLLSYEVFGSDDSQKERTASALKDCIDALSDIAYGSHDYHRANQIASITLKKILT